jgi:AraC-like DNA-binding protein
VLANTAPMVAHAHEDFNVIVHRDGPAVPWRVGARELLLEACHALIVRPWEVHERLAGANQPSVLLSFIVVPRWLDAYTAVALTGLGVGSPPRVVKLDAEVEGAVLRVMQMLQSPNDRTQLPSIVRRVLELLAASSAPPDALASFRRAPLDVRVRKVLDFIRANGAGRYSMEELCVQAGVSRAHLFKLFKAGLGTSPQIVLDMVRIDWASRALRESKMSIAEIAEELEFSTQGHFTRFFVMHRGVPPAEYRRMAS